MAQNPIKRRTPDSIQSVGDLNAHLQSQIPPLLQTIQNTATRAHDYNKSSNRMQAMHEVQLFEKYVQQLSEIAAEAAKLLPRVS